MKVQFASARGVAERWAKQYLHPKEGWRSTVNGSSKDIYERIIATGERDVDAVASIIGNKSWTHLRCSFCGEQVTRAAIIDDRSADGDVCICADCAREAHANLNCANHSESASAATENK